jgi:hypothetical protein
MKQRKKMVWFKAYFDLMVWISSKQQYFIAATLALRVANCSPILYESKYHFFCLGVSRLMWYINFNLFSA